MSSRSSPHAHSPHPSASAFSAPRACADGPDTTSLMQQSALVRIGLAGIALAGLWGAIAWAVLLP